MISLEQNVCRSYTLVVRKKYSRYAAADAFGTIRLFCVFAVKKVEGIILSAQYERLFISVRVCTRNEANKANKSINE